MNSLTTIPHAIALTITPQGHPLINFLSCTKSERGESERKEKGKENKDIHEISDEIMNTNRSIIFEIKIVIISLF